jgi:hypothetical protein
MKTLKHLKRAIAATGREIEIEETKPAEMVDEGSISLYLSEGHREQFSGNGLALVSVYYWSLPGSRAEAIADLLDRLTYGFEPMSEHTAWDCGIEIN